MSLIESLGLLSVAVLWWGDSNRPLFFVFHRLSNNSITEPWTCQEDGAQSRSRLFSITSLILLLFRCQVALNSFSLFIDEKASFILGIQAQATMIDVIVAVSSPQPESPSEPIRRGVIRLPNNWWSSRVKLWKWNFITFHAHCSSGWIWIIFQNIKISNMHENGAARRSHL